MDGWDATQEVRSGLKGTLMPQGSPRCKPVIIGITDAVSYRSQAPVLGTTAGIWTFPQASRPVHVVNAHDQANNLYILVNNPGVAASTTLYTHWAQMGTNLDVSERGQINVKHLSIFPGFGATDLDDHYIIWYPD